MLTPIDMTTKASETLLAIAREAGEEILKIYNDAHLSKQVESKSDNSPLTLADKASNAVIIESLRKAFPKIPILSEEERHVAYAVRSQWSKFWLVDPLDGTKEFIRRNGEFTVNIALIEHGFPTMGLIYAPVTKIAYFGKASAKVAYKLNDKEERNPLQVNSSESRRIAVGSRSHASEEESELLKSYDVVDTISVGSSLKFCMVAEGGADIYYRHGPTMEWDTGAGQAIVEAAGGAVLDMTTGQRFRYNKESLLNGSFLVKGFL
jgi:3'(2'), 5'-bisphosphate nucleotidase